jgi:uncharacterized protein (TIGR03067 family)
MKVRSLKAMAIFLALATLTALATADGAKQKAIAAELKKLDGTWKAVSMVYNGEPITEGLAEDEITFKDGRVTVTRNGKVFGECVLTVDPDKSPKTVDEHRVSGPLKGTTCYGIYKLEGDTFTVCYAFAANSRPGVFESKKDSGMLLIVARRQP